MPQILEIPLWFPPLYCPTPLSSGLNMSADVVGGTDGPQEYRLFGVSVSTFETHYDHIYSITILYHIMCIL